MKRAFLLVSLGLLSACWTTTADAGPYGRRLIPGVGEGSSVDTYLPNPDPQPPVVWSQGTEPPPPQADFGGGFWDLLAGGDRRGAAPRELIQRSLTPVWEAKRLCPDGVFLKRDFHWYESISRRMLAELAVSDEATFTALVAVAKEAVAAEGIGGPVPAETAADTAA